jgi:peptidoglycan/LPS O-acetylase OafA/YrhL
MAGTGRFDYLDGIRAVAIVVVLALHWFSWYVPLFHGGVIGVDLFFVLSGFIITTMLWRGSTGYGAFVRRRLVRLYPALLGLVLGSVLLYALVPSAPVDPVDVARRGVLVLTQASSAWAAEQDGSLWLPGLQPFGHTWSLAVEWYFYLAWPAFVLAARRRGWSARRLAVASLVVATVAYAGSLALGSFWFYFGPTARCAELLVGAALALHFVSAGRPAPRRATAPAALALGGVAAYSLLGADGSSAAYRYVGVPVAVLAAVVLIHTGYSGPGGPVHRLLGHRWVAAVGRHSYSLYLWHVVPFLLLEHAAAPRLVLGPLAVGMAVVLTVLSHRYLERPFLRARGDVLTPAAGRRPSPAPSPGRPRTSRSG